MRLSAPVLALLVAVLISGCGSLNTAPKPDPAGDTAFVTALRGICSKAAPLDQISPSASVAAIDSAAATDNGIVGGFEYGKHGLSTLTPALSGTSPLAPTITDMAEMLTDMSKWYLRIVDTVKRGHPTAAALAPMFAVAVTRGNQAQSDLRKLGVTSCLNYGPVV